MSNYKVQCAGSARIRELFCSKLVYLHHMLPEILQFLISTVLIAIYFVLIWLVTRFYKPKSLEVNFATPWKEASLAIGYVVGLFLVMGVVFFFLEDVAGVPVGTSRQFDIKRALSQWGVYATISLIPISLLIKIRKQSFETVGFTKKNMRLSLGM